MAIVFDLDGTLADSFGRYIRFAISMADKYPGICQPLPRQDDLAGWRGLMVVPMAKLLVKIGFSPEKAADIVDHEFADKSAEHNTRPLLFEGMAGLIARLKKEDCRLGIVTVNQRSKVDRALRELVSEFDVILSADDFDDKIPALTAAARFLCTNPQQAVYVGDSIKDFMAARAVGMPFIGVSFGWEISGSEEDFPIAASVEQLEWMLAFCQ